MSRILVGVSGGIAAYKACELVRLLVKAGHDVLPLTTPAAERFVSAATFAALARRSAREDLYAHLSRAELLVVAPCTANTLAKLAHGLADSLPTQAALAHGGPLLLAPAMNPRMWSHPATQANAALLRARGAEFVGPREGDSAEGEWGLGRMAEPDEIAARCEALLAPGSFAGRRVLVTAGGTREPLDAARFIGNRSSGRMGVALAAEARRRGAEVVLLAANLAVEPPAGVETVSTSSAREMLEVALGERFDVALLAAAVADYGPRTVEPGKRPKDGRPWSLELTATVDIARALGERKADGELIVLFGADVGAQGLERKRRMLEAKNADLVVFNDISRGDIAFEAEENEVVLVSRSGEQLVGKRPKSAVAVAILDEVERLGAR